MIPESRLLTPIATSVVAVILLLSASLPAQDMDKQRPGRMPALPPVFSGTETPPPDEVERIRKELREGFERDQEYRRRMNETRHGDALPPNERAKLANDLAVRDLMNRELLRRIFGRWGWPRISVFGEDADKHAWALLQHAGGEPDLQRLGLHLMELALSDGDTSPDNFAYLSDRAAVNECRCQSFGTQIFQDSEGCLHPAPLSDPADVDRLRAEFGMKPLREYLQEGYAVLDKPECKMADYEADTTRFGDHECRDGRIYGATDKTRKELAPICGRPQAGP